LAFSIFIAMARFWCWLRSARHTMLKPARKVLESHGGLDLVHVLTALYAGAHGRKLDVFVLDHDVDFVFDIGRDLDGGESWFGGARWRRTGLMRTRRCTPTSARK